MRGNNGYVGGDWGFGGNDGECVFMVRLCLNLGQRLRL